METNRLPNLPEEDACTGCAACAVSCTFNALRLVPDRKGFLRPAVESDACKGCGACMRACPVLLPTTGRHEPLRAIAAWDRNPSARNCASSGGLFMLLADLVLQRGGWVCGAILDSTMTVRHTVTRNRNVVDAMRGSKYVQSQVADALEECLAHLRAGDEVLFTGTACQVDAMKILAGKTLAGKLLAVDVLCHGAPSPAFWQAYLNYRGNCEGAAVTGARFRKKTPSWTVFSMELSFESGAKRSWPCDEDLYLRAFLDDYITRDACHSCPYIGTNRVGDITLADFWGYVSESRKDRNDEEGISLVLANTPKGVSAIDAVSGRAHMVEKPLTEAVKGNVPLRKPFQANPRTEEFWDAFERRGIEAVQSDFLGKKTRSKKHELSLWFNDHAYLFPAFMRRRMVDWRSKLK